MSKPEKLGQMIEASLDGYPDKSIGVAVSGGGDSIALLRLVVDWAAGRSVLVYAYSVDHGLRPEAGAEVDWVKKLCAPLGVQHRTLTWSGWDGRGNLSAAARKARYELIALEALQDGVKTVLLGHTQDDQAETVLMAVTRRAGADGLAAMPVSKDDKGLRWVRPLLAATRSDLREHLAAIDQIWIDDPTNEDANFERVRMRQAKDTLNGLGITADALSDLATNMQDTRDALVVMTNAALRGSATFVLGNVCFDKRGFLQQTLEIQRRLLRKSFGYVAPKASLPRRDGMTLALTVIAQGKDTSLGGCLVLVKTNSIWIVREPNAVKALETSIDAIWDDKWRVNGPATQQDLVIRALGEIGLKECLEWRDHEIPRPALLSSPSIWHGDRLIAAPLAKHSADWSAKTILGPEDYYS
jgi:tRNA(Ile)-lysidine synthase